jgi:3-methyladenine DNA glycosylase AlkC
MAEPFKNHLNAELVAHAARHITKHWPEFDEFSFVNQTCSSLNDLELKDRSRHIAKMLEKHLPQDLQQSCDLINKSLTPLRYFPHKGNAAISAIPSTDERGISGWFVMALCEWLERVCDSIEGSEQELELCFNIMHELTCRWSAEFVIRAFIIKFPQQTFTFIDQLIKSDITHHRRLATEGTRTRLPWGIRLTSLMADPSKNMEILEKLKDDEADYVRKSVANHLNDIAKDHADLVIEFCNRNNSNTKQRKTLIKQALRTLIKQGNADALAVIGFTADNSMSLEFTLANNKIKWNTGIEFSLSIEGKSDQPVLIDYVIYYQKSNGKQNPKVFKWREGTLDKHGKLSITGKQSFKQVTTRKHYAGAHKIAILVNGVEFDFEEKATFELLEE